MAGQGLMSVPKRKEPSFWELVKRAILRGPRAPEGRTARYPKGRV